MGNHNNNRRFGSGQDWKYVKFNGRSYAFDFNRMVEVCSLTSRDPQKDEIEISNVYDRDEEGEYYVSQKVEREMKRGTNSQCEMMCYDVIKLMMMSLIGDEVPENAFAWTMGTSLSFNTLFNLGILIEIGDDNQNKK